MTTPMGYELKSTFWEDFSIADAFGINAIKDTFKRAFEEWKNDYVMLTELTLVMNWKIWQHYETNEEYAELYQTYWEKTDAYAMDNLTDDELRFFLRVTD